MSDDFYRDGSGKITDAVKILENQIENDPELQGAVEEAKQDEYLTGILEKVDTLPEASPRESLPEETESPEAQEVASEDLPSVHKTPQEADLLAVQHFDAGLDDIVQGLKKMSVAADHLKEKYPEQFKALSTDIEDNLIPWTEKIDNDFQTMFPDVGEEPKK